MCSFRGSHLRGGRGRQEVSEVDGEAEDAREFVNGVAMLGVGRDDSGREVREDVINKERVQGESCCVFGGEGGVLFLGFEHEREGHIFGVTEVRVEERSASFCGLFDVSVLEFAAGQELLLTLWGQRYFDGYLAVTEVGGREHAREGELVGGEFIGGEVVCEFFEGIAQGLDDEVDVVGGELSPFGAEAFFHFGCKAGSVDELDFVLAMSGFFVVKDPEVGGDRGVVEHFRRQCDQCVEQVVVEDVLANVGLARASVASEQGGAVEHYTDTTTVGVHFVDEVLDEEHGAVGRAWEPCGEAPSGIGFDGSLFGLPIDTEGGVCTHELELGGSELVIGESVAEFDMTGVLAFEEHVGFADGIGLLLDFLTEVNDSGGVYAMAGEDFFGDGEDAASAAGGVVEEEVGVNRDVDGVDKGVSEELDDVAWGVKLAGGFVDGIRELADEFFKDDAHVGVGDVFRGEVDAEESLEDVLQEAGVGEALEDARKVEVDKDVLDGGGESCEVLSDVSVEGLGVVGVGGGGEAGDGGEVEGGDVDVRDDLEFAFKIEKVLGGSGLHLAVENGVVVVDVGGDGGGHVGLREDTVDTTEEGEREDD